MAQNVSLKADATVNISGSGKTLNAMKNIEAQAHSVSAANTNLNARTGRLNLSAEKGNITLSNTKLNTAQNLETTALQGSIITNGLHAASGGGYVSVLAKGNTDFNGKTVLQSRTGISAGSVGKGRLKADNTDIRAIAGEVNLVSGSDMQLGNGAQRNTIAGNGIHAKSGGSITAYNQSFNAGSGALTATAHNNLTLKNVQTASTHNTIIVAENGNTVLNGVTVASKRHIAVSSQKGAVLQNHNQNSRNSLTAQGVLSVQSDKENIADSKAARQSSNFKRHTAIESKIGVTNLFNNKDNPNNHRPEAGQYGA